MTSNIKRYNGTDWIFIVDFDTVGSDLAVLDARVDTLETSVDTLETSGVWNSAWGIIKVGTFIAPLSPHAVPSGDSTLTNPLVFTAITGRRYRIVFQTRAIAPTLTNTNVSFFLRDNGVGVRGWAYGGDPYVFMGGAYQGAAYEWLLNGDALSHSVEVVVSATGAADIYTDYGLWYAEDMGPISYGQPPAVDPTPPAIQWTPMTLLNSWVPFGGSNGPPVYRKVGDMVQVRGAVKNATPLVNPGVSTIANLPVGYRPPYNTNLSACGTGSDNWGAPNVMTLTAGGDLQVVRTAEGASNPHVFTSFDTQFSVTP